MLWRLGGAASRPAEARPPPAPGRFSTTTVWPHCRETTSPSVRARISTPPPAAYGTRMCTGLAGNTDWAEAIPPAANIAAPATAAQNGLHMASSLLVLLSASVSHTGPRG